MEKGLTSDEVRRYIYQLREMKIGDQYNTRETSIVNNAYDKFRRIWDGFWEGKKHQNRHHLLALINEILLGLPILQEDPEFPFLIKDMRKILIVLENTYSKDTLTTSTLEVYRNKLESMAG